MNFAIALTSLLTLSAAESPADTTTSIGNLSEFYARKCVSELTEGEKQRIRDRNRFRVTADLEIMIAEAQKAAECYEYIEGYVAGRNAVGPRQFCMSDEMDVAKVAQLFVEAVESRPEAKGMPRHVLLESILNANFSCKTSAR
jgi:Rap1a immunity proteins